MLRLNDTESRRRDQTTDSSDYRRYGHAVHISVAIEDCLRLHARRRSRRGQRVTADEQVEEDKL